MVQLELFTVKIFVIAYARVCVCVFKFKKKKRVLILSVMRTCALLKLPLWLCLCGCCCNLRLLMRGVGVVCSAADEDYQLSAVVTALPWRGLDPQTSFTSGAWWQRHWGLHAGTPPPSHDRLWKCQLSPVCLCVSLCVCVNPCDSCVCVLGGGILLPIGSFSPALITFRFLVWGEGGGGIRKIKLVGNIPQKQFWNWKELDGCSPVLYFSSLGNINFMFVAFFINIRFFVFHHWGTLILCLLLFYRHQILYFSSLGNINFMFVAFLSTSDSLFFIIGEH